MRKTTNFQPTNKDPTSGLDPFVRAKDNLQKDLWFYLDGCLSLLDHTRSFLEHSIFLGEKLGKETTILLVRGSNDLCINKTESLHL
jgi:hypothetical protein